MANERDQDKFNSDRESNEGRKTESGQQGQSGQETRTSGQPIGGNESNTGTGTTLSQGFTSAGGTGSAGAAGGGARGESAGDGGGMRGESPGDGGFVGSQGEESGEYLQDRDPKQAGFAEQGRGAPDEGRDIERGGERSANRDSDIEGSSDNR